MEQKDQNKFYFYCCRLSLCWCGLSYFNV